MDWMFSVFFQGYSLEYVLTQREVKVLYLFFAHPTSSVIQWKYHYSIFAMRRSVKICAGLCQRDWDIASFLTQFFSPSSHIWECQGWYPSRAHVTADIPCTPDKVHLKGERNVSRQDYYWNLLARVIFLSVTVFCQLFLTNQEDALFPAPPLRRFGTLGIWSRRVFRIGSHNTVPLAGHQLQVVICSLNCIRIYELVSDGETKLLNTMTQWVFQCKV